MRSGVRNRSDISALATLRSNSLCILLWNYHDDDVPRSAAKINLSLAGLPFQSGELRIQHFRIDHEQSNGFTAWQQMGSPQNPTAQQYAALEKAAELQQLDAQKSLRVENGVATVSFPLPAQAVSLLSLTW